MPRITLLAIVLLGAGLRMIAIGAKSIWLDEAISLMVVQRPLPELLSHLVRFDQHPPLYFVLLHFWVAGLGDHQVSVRMLSALLSIVTIPVFFAATRPMTDTPTGLVAAFLLAIAPFHIQFAQEARMYALLTLAVAVALYCVARLIKYTGNADGTAQLAPWRSWIGLALAQATVMLTHNTAAVFFPLALNLPILGTLWHSRRRGKAPELPALGAAGFLRRWLLVQALACALWSPWAIPFVLQSAGVDRGFWIPAPTFKVIWQTHVAYSFAFMPNWLPGVTLFALAFAALASYGAVVIRRWGIQPLLLSLFFTPIVSSLLFSLRRPIFYDRTLIWITLPYLMLLAAGVVALGALLRRSHVRVSDRQARYLTLLFMTGVTAFALYAYYCHWSKEEWDKAARYVADRARPDDLILVHASYVQLPFDYYFRRYPVDAQRRGLMVEYAASQGPEPTLTDASQTDLREVIGDHDHVWLVYSHEQYHDPAGVIPRELSRMLRPTDHRQFVDVQVFEYARAPGP